MTIAIRTAATTTPPAAMPPIAPPDRLESFEVSAVGVEVEVLDVVDALVDVIDVDDDVLVGVPLAQESSNVVRSAPHCHADQVGLSLCREFVHVRY